MTPAEARDCRHGRLARSCPECDLMDDLVEISHALALAEVREEEGRRLLREIMKDIKGGEWPLPETLYAADAYLAREGGKEGE